MFCKKCKKEFKYKTSLKKHEELKNCSFRCNICLKYYSCNQALQRHETVNCKQKYECDMCNHLYGSRFRLNNHVCQVQDKDQKIPDISQLVENIPDNKNIVINIVNKVNSDNVNSNNKINSNNKVRIRNNFFLENPKSFHHDYIDADKYKEFAQIDDYSEEHADMFMYEESDFKDMPKNIVYKYEKEMLQVKGMKMLFTELQKNPNNRNVRIKKSKSGKCYVYNNDWIEKKMKDIVTKICCKLCDNLYNQETSLNHFIRLTIADQPRRISELRKHIEEEITKLNYNDQMELLEN